MDYKDICWQFLKISPSPPRNSRPSADAYFTSELKNITARF